MTGLIESQKLVQATMQYGSRLGMIIPVNQILILVDSLLPSMTTASFGAPFPLIRNLSQPPPRLQIQTHLELY
jgi:hypothetical protein